MDDLADRQCGAGAKETGPINRDQQTCLLPIKCLQVSASASASAREHQSRVGSSWPGSSLAPRRASIACARRRFSAAYLSSGASLQGLGKFQNRLGGLSLTHLQDNSKHGCAPPRALGQRDEWRRDSVASRLPDHLCHRAEVTEIMMRMGEFWIELKGLLKFGSCVTDLAFSSQEHRIVVMGQGRSGSNAAQLSCPVPTPPLSRPCCSRT